ncbi:NADH oxidase [Sphaceloma murrayae]|uniref:NADH oxidase n=1 Tax=Sphaceloma murrayae TaxID=2082308 RepID=A0A2K1QPG7_9PEZI|nr:NADH oxidase [Sphaceloma murrayae]
MASNSRLFSPLQIGPLTLSSRLIMAPLTRFRADDAHVPLPFVKDYYVQRACVPGTLLITEATFISPAAGGYPNVPGIYNQAQIDAWKEIVDAVHEKGSYIYLQLWALGRAAKAGVLKEEIGGDVVSASDVAIKGGDTPRALTEDEIWGYVKDYATAAKNAVQGAGFDGVEIHGANGYLVDQFLQDGSNTRTDAWGGSVEKRSRFGVEVTKAVVEAVGADKVGIRLSPWSEFQDMKMKEPIPQFSHILGELKKMKLAYMHVVESRISGSADIEATDKNEFVFDIWDVSPVLVAGGFKPDSAKRLVDDEFKDKELAVVFGRYWISTPDLVYRIKKGIELTPYDRKLFYQPKKPDGYIDYPFSEEFLKESKL